MAFVGLECELQGGIASLPAGEYYVLEETGEVYDSEHEALDACWSYIDKRTGAPISEDDARSVPKQHLIADLWTRYREEVSPRYLVTRQMGFYRALNGEPYSVNICRDPDHIPPGMLAGNKPFRAVEEAMTLEGAVGVALHIARQWAAILGESVVVESDTAECGGADLFRVTAEGAVQDLSEVMV